jgi:hypothetical protein
VGVQLTSGLTLQSHQPSTLRLQARERVRVVAKPCHIVAFLAHQSSRRVEGK